MKLSVRGAYAAIGTLRRRVMLRSMALGVAGADLGLLHTGHGSTGVGDVALGTGAGGPVVHHLTLGVGSTGRTAGVGAPVVDAGVGLGAVRVLATSHNAHLVQTHVAQETVIVNTTRH